ncbi:MAG: trypsin-like peptidase domain-containing protein [Oligoflexales bacterium]|nr:trypsin-like peptidase domain-containing protein [Oligoflexales bacterium]
MSKQLDKSCIPKKCLFASCLRGGSPSQLFLFFVFLSLVPALVPVLRAQDRFPSSDALEPSSLALVSLKASPDGPRPSRELLLLYDYFFKGRVPSYPRPISLGSGVIISHEGHVVTNYHMVRGLTEVSLVFSHSQRTVKASLVGVDSRTDLALFRFKPEKGLKFYPISFMEGSKLKLGMDVWAIGNPFGVGVLASRGVLSSLTRSFGDWPFDALLATNMIIHPGFSGGALIDYRGRLVGINRTLEDFEHRPGFVIPADLVKTVVSDLKAFGKVMRPWLGLALKFPESRDELPYAGADLPTGILVSNLIPNSPAQKAGLRMGDMILKLDKAPIHQLIDIDSALSKKKPGQKVEIAIFRRGEKRFDISLILDEEPKHEDLSMELGSMVF